MIIQNCIVVFLRSLKKKLQFFPYFMAGINPVDASPDSGLATPYHRISGIVAVNMIMAGASGGVVAVSIAVWAQVRS